MKIVISTAVYYPMINGVAVFSHNLAVGLAQMGHEVLVLCPSQKRRGYARTVDGVKTVYLHSTDVKVYPDQIHSGEKRKILGIPSPFYKNGFKVSLFPGRRIRKVLDKFQPDVVHVQVSDPIGIATVKYAREKGIPVVTTEHNQPEVLTEPLGFPEFISRPVEGVLNAYLAHRQSKSDFVTMPTRRAILKFLDGREFTVPIAAVSNGVDLSNFKPGKADAKLYKEYGLNPDFRTVLYVGRVDPEKKVGVVLEAFKAISKEITGVQLAIVGDGVDKTRLEKLAEGDENIHFLGRITPPELYKVYQMGDVFVTASEIETQGIVLIEAVATGLPLVAVDKGAVAEICRDGENGILCQPGDVEGVSKALKTILSDDKLRLKYAKKSVELAREHDFSRTLEEFINIYKKVINDKTVEK